MTQRTKNNARGGEVDIQAAAALVLQREQQRKSQASDRARKRHGQRHKKQLAAVEQMRRSLEVTKWFIVGIAVVVLLGITFLSVKLNQSQQNLAEIERKFTQLEEDVAQIEREVDRFKSSVTEPLESLGRSIGEKIDAKLNALMEGNETQSDE